MVDFHNIIASENGVKKLMLHYAIVLAPGVIRGDVSKQNGGFKKIKTGYFTLREYITDELGRKIEVIGGKGAVEIDYYEPDRVFGNEFRPPDSVKAYWLAYSQNKAYRAVIDGDEADFIFTPNMSGCTFARGSQAGSNAIMVGHANYINGATADERMDRQAEMLDEKFGAKNFARKWTLNKNNYANIDYPALYRDETEGRSVASYCTVIGKKEGGIWEFWCQRFARASGGRIILHTSLQI